MKQHFLWVFSEKLPSFAILDDLVLVGYRLRNTISSVPGDLHGCVSISLTSHSRGGCGSVSKGSATLPPPELKAVAKFVNQTSFPPEDVTTNATHRLHGPQQAAADNAGDFIPIHGSLFSPSPYFKRTHRYQPNATKLYPPLLSLGLNARTSAAFSATVLFPLIHSPESHATGSGLDP